MIQLPPTEFTYGKYEGQVISWQVIKSMDTFVSWLSEQNIVGYCNSLEVEIRPRSDNMAVMFEEDNYQNWCHIPIDVWNEYLKRSGYEI